MPQITNFPGFITRMYFVDLNPPYFQASYAAYQTIVDISKLELRSVYLPPRVLGLVIEWATLNQASFMENWERTKQQDKLLPIRSLV